MCFSSTIIPKHSIHFRSIIIFSFIITTVYNCQNFNSEETNKKNSELILSTQIFLDMSYALSTQEKAKLQIGFLPDQSPGAENDSKELIQLGNKIFRDINLSANRIQACITCHPLDGRSAGMDRQSTSRGTFGQLGKRNTPTILNIGFSSVLFWDGRRTTLYEQAIDPFVNPLEMSLPSDTELITRIQNDPSYQNHFSNTFPNDPTINLHKVRLALSAFQRSLVSKSKFDDFVKGDILLLNKQELDGLNLFLDLGCNNCHSGFSFGGNGFAKLEDETLYNPNDFGKYEVSGNTNDRFVFKVPSLRNVFLTGPYFHDGSVSSLREVIIRMNSYKKNQTMDNSEIEALIAFLKTLSDRTKSN
ncbi:di-heme cytochrome C peroxidase [Leptospira yanagawae serovar Saopaulo str. Sao Paulo = ATCC 700523]|uniref:Di-heme cytochrome C peroxidase n=2 Tax=Leptospira yanagawae TaxID=293069 RepID=A0A5E8HG73_9LEPT|nr:di-heme cytochrome C peroxidase [Leptospira yanagawae serovar Saopaulo str. Sao Paulo = ATCC 700523]